MHNEVRADADPDAHSRFQAIYACVPECVKLIDASERLIDMNPAGLRMIDAPSLSLVRDRNILELIAPEYRQAFREAHAAVFRGKAVRIQFEVVGFAGRRLWMDQSAAPLFDTRDSSRVVEMVAVTRDITAQREGEVELLQARIVEGIARARAEMLAGVGHGVNAPLNDMIGYSELLQEAALDQGRHGDARDLQRIIDAARQVLSIVHRATGASPCAQERQMDAGPHDLREVVEDAIESARAIVASAGTALAIELPCEPRYWGGDREKLDMCLSSLLLSVAKLAPNGSVCARLPLLAEAGAPSVRIEFSLAGLAATVANSHALASSAAGHSSLEAHVELPRRLARLMGGDVLVTSVQSPHAHIALTLPG